MSRYWLTYVVVSLVVAVALYLVLRAVEPRSGWAFGAIFAAFMFFPRQWIAERLSGRSRAREG